MSRTCGVHSSFSSFNLRPSGDYQEYCKEVHRPPSVYESKIQWGSTKQMDQIVYLHMNIKWISNECQMNIKWISYEYHMNTMWIYEWLWMYVTHPHWHANTATEETKLRFWCKSDVAWFAQYLASTDRISHLAGCVYWSLEIPGFMDFHDSHSSSRYKNHTLPAYYPSLFYHILPLELNQDKPLLYWLEDLSRDFLTISLWGVAFEIRYFHDSTCNTDVHVALTLAVPGIMCK